MNIDERQTLIQTRLEAVNAALADTIDLIEDQGSIGNSLRTVALLQQTPITKKKAEQHKVTMADLTETKSSLETDRTLLLEALKSIDEEITHAEVEQTEAVEVQFSESLREDVIDAQVGFIEAFARFYALSHIQARRQGAHIDQRGLFNYTFHPEQGYTGQFETLVDQYRAEYQQKMEAAA